MRGHLKFHLRTVFRRRHFKFMGQRLFSSTSSNVPDVVLHIGAPKSGSSAIQRFSVLNRPALLDAGYFYPVHPLDPNGVSGGHTILRHPLVQKDHNCTAAVLFSLLEESHKMGATLILSSESFFARSADLIPYLEGLNVQVIAWFRNPVDASIANHNQSIKRSFSTQTVFEKFDNISKTRRNSVMDGEHLYDWAGAFGDDACTFLPYCGFDANNPGLIERQWLNALGIPTTSLGRFKFDYVRVNRSYVPSALELKRLLNFLLNDEHEDICLAVDHSLQQYSDQSSASDLMVRKRIPNKIIRKIEAYFSETNQRIVERFPSLEPILDTNKATLSPAELQILSKPLDLRPPLQMLVGEYPAVAGWLREQVTKKVEAGDGDKALRALAKLLDIPAGQSGS